MPTSLFSIHLIHRIAPLTQFSDVKFPPRPETKPATLPSTAAAVAVAIGDVQSKFPPGVTQVETEVNVAPNPYCSTILCAVTLPLFLHCSPLNAIAASFIVEPVVLLKQTAIQPATVPAGGLPK